MQCVLVAVRKLCLGHTFSCFRNIFFQLFLLIKIWFRWLFRGPMSNSHVDVVLAGDKLHRKILLDAETAYNSRDITQYSLDYRSALNTVKQHLGYIAHSLARFDSLKQDAVAEKSPKMNEGVRLKQHITELEQAIKTVCAVAWFLHLFIYLLTCLRSSLSDNLIFIAKCQSPVTVPLSCFVIRFPLWISIRDWYCCEKFITLC